jgi:glycosyltransferase involved in cell wall biosynthesis
MSKRLLIVTDILDVDDLAYGYIHRWIEEIVLFSPSVRIITSKKGYHTLPPRVAVHSLGKEEKRRRWIQALRMVWFMVRYTRSYDDVLVLGSPWRVVRLGWWWKLWRKNVGLWFKEGDVSLPLSIARPFLSYIFTPTTYGYHGGGDIKRIIGYGVDVTCFKPLPRPKHDGTFRAAAVGAITYTKDYETMLRAWGLLTASIDRPAHLTIVGTPGPGEESYAEEVRNISHSLGLGDMVTFAGPMKNVEVAHLLEHTDVYLSMNTTPSLEKSLIEAAASAVPIITANQSFAEFARGYHPFVFFESQNATELAERIRHIMLMSHDARRALGMVFRNIAVHQHSLESFARGIAEAYDHSS